MVLGGQAIWAAPVLRTPRGLVASGKAGARCVTYVRVCRELNLFQMVCCTLVPFWNGPKERRCSKGFQVPSLCFLCLSHFDFILCGQPFDFIFLAR